MTLTLHRIGFEGRHGASAIERTTARRFEVDVEIDADFSAAMHSDRLGDTLDFAKISALIVRLGTEGEPHHLLESLAYKMVQALLAERPSARIRLELRKILPPYCPGAPDFASIRLDSSRL